MSAYRRPVKAKAAATVAVVAGSVLVMGALTALGIGCANGYNNHEWNQKCQSIWDGMSEAVRDSVSVISGGPSQAEVVAKYADKFMASTYQGFAAEFPPGTPLGSFASNDAFVTSMKWTATYSPPSYLGATPWGNYFQIKSLSNINLVKIYNEASLPLKINGINLSVQSTGYSGGAFTINYSLDDNWNKGFTSTKVFIPFHNGAFETSNVEWAELTAYDSAAKCDVWLLLDNYGATGYVGYKDATTTVPDKVQISTTQPYVPGDKNVYAQGHSVLNNSYDDVMAKIKAAQGTLDSINLKISDAVGNLSEINDQVRTQTQAQEVGQSIADTATDAAANEAVNTGRDTTVPQAPAMPNMIVPAAITKKFPFSIPWDLYNSIKNLAFPGKAPCWTWTFKTPVGTYPLKVDMKDWEPAAVISRWGLSLLFLIGLILLTNKVIKH